MTTFTILDWSHATESERARVITRGGNAAGLGPNSDIRTSIQALVDRVRVHGDTALVEALRVYDDVLVPASRLRVDRGEVERARSLVSDQLLQAIRTSIAQSRQFNELIRDRASWKAVRPDGTMLGERASAIPSVGLFVPSGKGSYPSVAIQIATPAVVAGVERIVVGVPPLHDGTIDPATLVALDELGVRDIFRCNGPAGIAAMALGTESVPRVGKIVGPGGRGVTLAQMLVQQFGTVVEVGFGPTDAAIIADGSADPKVLAADLLNEAEHGSDSSAILISTDRRLLESVVDELTPQLERLPEPRCTYAVSSIAMNGGLILAADMAQAAEIANDYGAEHLLLAVADPEAWMPLIRYAGTILLGPWTTFAMSNFATGTPATLPTTGFAKVSSGVTAATYLVRSAVASLTEEAFWRLAPTVEALAAHEGFPAHAATVSVRRRP